MSIADREHRALPLSGSSQDGSAVTAATAPHGQEEMLQPYPADPAFDELGYKVLLYLTRCFQGRVLGSAEHMSTEETAMVSRGQGGM